MESARRLTPPPRFDSDAPPSGIRTTVPRPASKSPASVRPVLTPPPLVRPSAPPAEAVEAEVVVDARPSKTPPPLPRRAPASPGTSADGARNTSIAAPPPSARAAVKPRAPRVETLSPATRPTLKTIVNEGMTAPPVATEAPPSAPRAVVASPLPARPAIAPPPPIPVSSRPSSVESAPPAPKSSQSNPPPRTFATTAQDWPIAKVPSAPGMLEPGFGSPPKVAASTLEVASERSLPAFRPPADMLLHEAAKVEAANDGVFVETVARGDDDVAPPVVHDMVVEQAHPVFEADEVELPFHSPLRDRLAQLPRWACFAAGLAAGVVVTLIAS
jgi:hypothetical protein